MNSYLKTEEIEAFHCDGVVVLPGFFDLKKEIEPIQRGIYDVIGQVLKQYRVLEKREPFTPSTFYSGYQELIALDRKIGGVIYDAVKQIPAFVRLVTHPAFSIIFKALRRDAIPGVAAGGYGIRIDNPNEERYRAPWHQEYPAQLRSLDGLVFASPLLEIVPELGPVEFCLGSHKEGVLPVYSQDAHNPEKSGAYGLTLKSEKELINKYQRIAPLTSPGDLVILDWLVIHSSGKNVSQRSRWSMQIRYFNFAEPTGMSYWWKGSFANAVDFRDIHPKLCKD